MLKVIGLDSLEDLKGKKISAPNGIGNSSYNIGARFFDADGINPLTEVEFVQVETSACVPAMESGEIAAVVAGDMWAWDMWKNGQLKWLRSITWDEDFTDEPCCVTVMNKDFINENPLMAKYITKAINKAQTYIGENIEEITQAQIDEGLLTTMKDADKVMEKVWWPQDPDHNFN